MAGSLRRVLLVEDDPDFALGTQLLLEQAGHFVTHATSARAAVDALRTARFDVAFLDLHLPDGDGLRLITELQALEPTLAVICLTGRDDATTAVQAMRLGALDYLVKPLHRETLLRSVEAAAALHARTAERHIGSAPPAFPGLPVSASPAWQRTLELIRAAGRAPRTTVLLVGEPGVGKEVAASLVHAWSARAGGPYVTVNAACLAPNLVESELFGHESGAFTGAARQRKGLFEQAKGGTLFLDEIGELPLELQAKLLRVLEGHAFRRLGGEQEVSSDARVVCATNRDLEKGVAAGTFRADLRERLRVFEIRLPPLRERREDIRHLATHFVVKLGHELGMRTAELSPDVFPLLEAHDWPGNVRELRNVLERALVLCGGGAIRPSHLPADLLEAQEAPPEDDAPPVLAGRAPAADGPAGSAVLPLEEAVRRHVTAAFASTGGNLSRCAEQLGISRVALRNKLRAYGLKPVRG